MPFVEMDDPRHDPQRRERSHTADTQQQLLANPHPFVATVKPRRQFTILRRISFNVGIEQEQRVSADGELPDSGDHAPRPRLQPDAHRLTVLADRLTKRQFRVIDVDVVLLLPTVEIEPLAEIPLVVAQSDADQRDVEIGSALDVIARQDAQSAGIDRHRFVQAELG